MKIEELDDILQKTLEDDQLSKTEKRALKEIFADYRNDIDALNFIRSRAFEMARRGLNQQADIRLINWLEGVIQALFAATHNKSPLNEAYFSPGEQCRDRILSLIENAKNSADICVFTISDNHIADALLRAHDRNVNLRIISDDVQIWKRGSDIIELSKAGIAVRLDKNPETHMHNKFAIFDGLTMVTGSYNWTLHAARYNQENIVVTNDSRIILNFSETFNRLWDAFAP